MLMAKDWIIKDGDNKNFVTVSDGIKAANLIRS